MTVKENYNVLKIILYFNKNNIYTNNNLSLIIKLIIIKPVKILIIFIL